ncbi:unnamed protein product [Zymoseptoria tritici ST99CH_1A5]|uniref:Uncharacterized protein n=2 Tax=Zymoseptoria tritici TaxID=1047171 RepID=A0A2H1GHJ2_ZYMTR|nr:unnamed protein product [Zymoseptoria tritici ST99CH_1E4]SMR54581.1 unnamed protein product [Zymoseptoria tritici ST99CH_3D1]SMY24775.1 unnamed protein product [Zymoseptoria tritici ST99CH_1A5]
MVSGSVDGWGPGRGICSRFYRPTSGHSRHTAKLVRQVQDEIDVAFDAYLNTNTEGQWKEVKIKPVIESVVFNTTNRIFVGLPLCRSERFKKAINRWTMALGIGLLFCRYLIPGPMRPLITPVIAAPANFFIWRAVSYLTPTIKDRILEKNLCRASTKTSCNSQPNDMVQWIVDHNAQKADPAELKPSNIAG